jgi:HTH-type transcriptional regulator, transcriptional repressor of NAD biosynthesis genes
MSTKKFKKGLIIGKFYPFHKGHSFLIREALKKTEHLVVIICHTDKYKIPVEERAGWIKAVFPQIEVKILCHDPSLDSTSIKISGLWAKKTIAFLGYAPDAVFSSEKYGDAYAKHMGSQHIMVDYDRKNVKISATKIRGNLYKYWNYLEDPVRSYFTSRIVVLGAESTGTTTLARDLAKHYQTTWVPEYGRVYSEGKRYSDKLSSWTTPEFFHIAQMQNLSEEAFLQISKRILICDTDALATTIWHLRYVGIKDKALEKLVNTSKHALYILTGTDIPFVQDGLRDGEHLREWMHQTFLEELTKRMLKYVVVTGSREERLKKAIKSIDSISQQNYLF